MCEICSELIITRVTSLTFSGVFIVGFEHILHLFLLFLLFTLNTKLRAGLKVRGRGGCRSPATGKEEALCGKSQRMQTVNYY